jgi:hypothetical protein
MNVNFATEPGSPDTPNEDWVGATANAVVVLDGISTPAGFETGCIHGTVWFVHQLGAWLLGLASTEPDVPLRDHLAASIKNVAATHAATCDTNHLGTPGATVAMLRERGDQVDWLVLSDSYVVLDTIHGIQVHTDDSLDRFAAAERAAVRAEIIGTPEHDTARAALVKAQRLVRNTEGGYWVAAADPRAAQHALTQSISRAGVRQAALLTDGAVMWGEAENDWASWLSALTAAGPGLLIHSVRSDEAADARGWIRGRFKASDDATVAACTF